MSSTSTYAVNGMTCEHCVASVREEVGEIDGVQSVDVDLVAGGVSTVRVRSESELDDDTIVAAINEAGYALAHQA